MIQNPDLAKDMTIIVTEEEWVLDQKENEDKSAPRVWTGSYQLNQKPRAPPTDNDPQNAPVMMSFYLEIYEKGADVPETKMAQLDGAPIDPAGAPGADAKDDSSNSKTEPAKSSAEKPAGAAKAEPKAAKKVERVVTEFDDLTLD